MSIGGPSGLGTLLIQRLDAALGATLSQQSNLVTGARPDAVSQPADPHRPDPVQNPTQRHPRESVDKAQERQPERTGIDRSRVDARASELAALRPATSTETTRSAPTTLGRGARAILALLANHPQQSATVQGRAPLLSAQQAAALSALFSQTGAQSATRAGGAPAGATTDTAVINAAEGRAASSGQGSATSAGGAVPGSAASAASLASANSPAAPLPTLVRAFAHALSQSVQNSGLFYESHLNNLAFGKASKQDLLLQPQSRLSMTSRAEGVATGDASFPRSPTENTTTSQGQPPAPHTAPSQTLQQAPTAQTPASLSAVPGQGSTSALQGIDPQTHVLVRQQLEVLANQSFTWRGEAWPDAPSEWEIRREPHHPGGEDAPGADHWATRINLNLPGLGEIRARLNLADKQLVLHLDAPVSSGLLSQHAQGLRDRLQRQGLNLNQISIATGDEPPSPAHDAEKAVAAHRTMDQKGSPA